MARLKPQPIFHSSWELIHHIVIWQDAILAGLKGKTVNWKEIGQKYNWPTTKDMEDDIDFVKLTEKFMGGLKTAEELIDSLDLFKKVSLWEEITGFEAFMGLLQHNSYHSGQIITVRKILGNWHLKDWVLEE